MIRTRTVVLALLLAIPGAAHAAPRASAFGIARFTGTDRPDFVLAQRVIEREWGPSDDSVYVEVDVPGLKSEPLAVSLSALVPGAGQLYVGEGSGWIFAALEAAGWGGYLYYQHEAHKMRDRAGFLAGDPTNPASNWSSERWASVTNGDPSEIEALYAADRSAFYSAIATDPRYDAGWVDADAQARFRGLRDRSEWRLDRSRTYATALWLNHLVAAVDALRAARLNNFPLGDRTNVRLEGGFREGAPAFALALERKF